MWEPMKPAPPVTQTARDVMSSPLSGPGLHEARPVERRFYQRPTLIVARDLLGKLLVRELPQGIAVVRVAEVEAYLGISDPAAHTFAGRRTRRVAAMWGDGGHLYVYFTYGMHFCANVVTRRPGEPEAVLLRGAVAVAGREHIAARRGGVPEARLLDGPAKLCQGLGIYRELDGADLTTGGAIALVDDGLTIPDALVRRLRRVGVAYAGEAAAWPLRLLVNLGAPWPDEPRGARDEPGRGDAGR